MNKKRILPFPQCLWMFGFPSDEPEEPAVLPVPPEVTEPTTDSHATQENEH